MNPSPLRTHRPSLGLAVLVVVLSGCGGDAFDRAGDPPHRTPDGLLADAELQEVVELQVARNGEGLAQRLGSSRAVVRARAAFALGSVQDPAATGPLVAALADTSAAVRGDAAFALGQIGAAEGVRPLVERFSAETEGPVRRRILDALGRIGTLEAVQAVVSLTVRADEEPDRILALARLGATRGVATREGHDLLMASLDHPDREVRRYAAWYFGRLPDPAVWADEAGRVRSVVDGYASDEPAAMYLLQALGRLSNPADGGRLRAWLTEGEDWRIRANAAAGLAFLPPDPQNREALLSALDDPSEHVAITAGQSLLRGSPVPSEMQRLKSWIEANPDRWQAAAPLLLLLAQGDEREFVFAWIDALPADDPYRWSAGLSALAAMPGVEAVERLQTAVASEDPRIQGAGVGALTRRWSQDRFFAANHQLYFDMLVDALHGESLQGAFTAAETLSDPTFAPLGSEAALAAAFRAMSLPRDLEPMMATLQSLTRIGGEEALAVLSEAALSPHPGIRSAAVAGLEALDAPVPAYAGPAEDEGVEEAALPVPPLDWSYLASLGGAPLLRLETEEGVITVRLLTEEAPHTVQTVARLASEGRYDGTAFHRVVANFVIQGGDFSAGDGFGGPGFTITTEDTTLPYLPGVIGMASAGRDTEGSQFFITHSRQPHLDGAYSAFGWVTSGMEVVERIQIGDRILRATVEPGG